MPAIRVLLADDQQIMRQGLRALLESEKGFQVIGEAPDGRQAVKLACQLTPDVVVMDIGMPDLNGIEATRQILAKEPAVKVVALSMHSDKQFVAEMLAAGASGYLVKDCAFEQLIDAIRTVLAGRVCLSPAITGVVIEDYVQRVQKDSPINELTDREREVLQLLAEGTSTKQIASRLNMSVKTAETHRRNIMQKLDLHSVAELTKYAVRHGLTDLRS